jgi:hypothetical protein
MTCYLFTSLFSGYHVDLDILNRDMYLPVLARMAVVSPV